MKDEKDGYKKIKIAKIITAILLIFIFFLGYLNEENIPIYIILVILTNLVFILYRIVIEYKMKKKISYLIAGIMTLIVSIISMYLILYNTIIKDIII